MSQLFSWERHLKASRTCAHHNISIRVANGACKIMCRCGWQTDATQELMGSPLPHPGDARRAGQWLSEQDLDELEDFSLSLERS